VLPFLGLWWEGPGGGGGPPADGEDPTGSFAYPQYGATVSGTVTLTVTASDNEAVTSVEFFSDGVSLGTDSTDPYTQVWDTTAEAEGWHDLAALITDTSANDFLVPAIRVYVDNVADPPPSGSDVNSPKFVGKLRGMIGGRRS
jgi:hypothetical protein